MKVKLTFVEEVLGTASSNPDIHEEFIASKAPDAATREEEIAAVGVDEIVEKSMTVFPRRFNRPVLWDYQLKGFFKDSCGMLKRCSGTHSSKVTAYKKIIDGLIFPQPRAIELHLPEGLSLEDCQRPLRGQTAQGERIALANSEAAPPGTWIEFEILMLPMAAKKGGPSLEDLVTEWLNYGKLRGIGAWRNSGKGRFEWALIEEGKEIVSL